MSNFLLLLILFVLASVLLLIVYLIDRVNIIEKVTLKFTGDSKLQETDKSGIFGELRAENLWGAMSGIPTPGWDNERLTEVRPRYEVILQKHAQAIFDEGVLDGKKEETNPPSNTYTVGTLRGNVESWIPQQYADEIYESGNERGKNPDGDLKDIKNNINQSYSNMLKQVSLEPAKMLSDLVLPLELDRNPDSLSESDETENADDPKMEKLAEAINEELNTPQTAPETAVNKKGGESSEQPPKTSGDSQSTDTAKETPQPTISG